MVHNMSSSVTKGALVDDFTELGELRDVAALQL